MQRAVNRLAGWPGLPHNFVTITNNQIDQSLDAANDQLDAIFTSAPVGNPARWLPDLSSILGLFVKPAIPGYSISDTLNAVGDFLNRIMPPFNISPGAGTFGIITQYKIMGAAVAGTATVLSDMLNGVYDPAQWEIDVIKSTTGATVTRADLSNSTTLQTKIAASVALGGGVYSSPEQAWNITLPTWTDAQVNPFTIVTYVALVAIYKRFQEMAVLTPFTTSTTYDSWHYTNALGMYAAGTFHAVDPDGRPVTFPAGGSLGATYTSTDHALVTVNTTDGGFTYTPPSILGSYAQNAAYLHRSTSENEADRYDTVNIPVQSADGVSYTVTFKISIIDGTNANPTGSFSVTSTDALGVVKGKVIGSDSDGDTLKYSLVGSSVNGLSGNSAYTKDGAGNGGIVTLNPTTGDFTYVSSATAGATQSFQVMINDGHYGNTPITVTVPNTTSITPANVNTSTPYVVTGAVPTSTNLPPGDPGRFTGYALGTAPTKGSVTSFDPVTGAFTYTSSVGRTPANDDVVTVIATDANGRTVTLKMAVKPSFVNVAPTVVLTTAPTEGTLSGTVQTSTGKLTVSDADGDNTFTYTASGLASGASVSFAADGSFTYTTDISTADRHAAAKYGATSAQKNQTFAVTVSDQYGGSTPIVVTVPIYAVNTPPVISKTKVALTYTIKITDAEDTIPTTKNPGTGQAGYSLSNGGTLVGILSVGVLYTTTSTITVTAWDGYYVVDSNGHVTTTLSSTTV